MLLAEFCESFSEFCTLKETDIDSLIESDALSVDSLLLFCSEPLELLTLVELIVETFCAANAWAPGKAAPATLAPTIVVKAAIPFR